MDGSNKLIWLIAGTKTLDECPDSRKDAVKAILLERVEAGKVSAERYAEITGEIIEEVVEVID